MINCLYKTKGLFITHQRFTKDAELFSEWQEEHISEGVDR